MTRRALLALALFTLLGIGGLGTWLVIAVQERQFLPMVLGDRPWVALLVCGPVLGSLTAWCAWRIIAWPRSEPMRHYYADLIGPWMRHGVDRWAVSICAGIGEELLFRGALQFWLGIPITAVLFVAVHGYLDPRKPPLLAYGLYMTAAMMVFGWMAREHGLLAPTMAHIMVDLVLIDRLVADHRARRST
ncbi:MAG: CPBP family intramembrane metalloprotease [Flavobacteriales bacterium]|nr:CPBP family intramembrane metalloprotease [Flavobacteriales bacterium]MCB9193672.1 CPBP family intramembrane metalloprotease [Flavobacteriales bacterium]